MRYSTVITAITLAVVAVLALVLSGCGGGGGGTSAPAQARPQAVITAAQAFANVRETWTFVNGYGDITTVSVEPVDADHSIWHYGKSSPRAYWAVGIPEADLYFDLERDTSGGWYSTGGLISFPQGCPWCKGPFRDMRFSVSTKSGQARPYLIVPSQTGQSYQTVFDDITPIAQDVLLTVPDTVWKTAGYVEHVDTPVFSGDAFVSDQNEGPCVHEKWYFAPGKGLVLVQPFDFGDCKGIDPKLAMVRVG